MQTIAYPIRAHRIDLQGPLLEGKVFFHLQIISLRAGLPHGVGGKQSFARFLTIKGLCLSLTLNSGLRAIAALHSCLRASRIALFQDPFIRYFAFPVPPPLTKHSPSFLHFLTSRTVLLLTEQAQIYLLYVMRGGEQGRTLVFREFFCSTL